MHPPAPEFDASFRERFYELLRWRRDVRRFSTRPVPGDVLRAILQSVHLAPSVGLSQPTRLVLVESPARREVVCHNFERENQLAAVGYSGERARRYVALKLAGLREAPVHLAVFCDEETRVGHGLGQRTMPETLRYSTVAAIYGIWLAARAWNVGVGWVSILDPQEVRDTLQVPPAWHFVAYLCLGYPLKPHDTPELEREGWERRRPTVTTPLVR